MKRLLLVGLSLSALALGQHGRAVRAGGGPKVQVNRPAKVTTPKVAKQGAGPRAEVKAAGPRGEMKGAGPQDVLAHLEKHPNAVERLQPLLPEGMPIETAAEGFKNFGQFNAALHVSQNLGIPFDQLKLEMRGENPKSLGQAIHTLRPDLPDGEVEQAVVQAEVQVQADAAAVGEQERVRERAREHQPTTQQP